jgi:CRISPR type IV-associated protein Csf3
MSNPVYMVVFDLSGPPASSDKFIHFDGLLSFAAGVESVGYDGLDELDDGGEPEYWADEMPLRQVSVGDDWVWAASSLFAPMEADGEPREPPEWTTERWRSRFDNVPKHQQKRTQVAVTSGAFKSYNAAQPHAVADTARFFFEPAADATPQDVAELLKAHITHVGAKSSQGFGHITDFEIQDVSDAVGSALYLNGCTMRSLPVSFVEHIPSGAYFEDRTTKPPYWHAANQELAFPPFAEVDADVFDDELGIRAGETEVSA